MFWPQTVVPMTTINWIALIPATFIQVWAVRRFYVAAWRAASPGQGGYVRVRSEQRRLASWL